MSRVSQSDNSGSVTPEWSLRAGVQLKDVFKKLLGHAAHVRWPVACAAVMGAHGLLKGCETGTCSCWSSPQLALSQLPVSGAVLASWPLGATGRRLFNLTCPVTVRNLERMRPS